ncbi:MAG: 5-deoxy-glucuronate isomerase [Rhodanobacter sp.]|nr:MAG: 5-deoxy-glucuronate isomerase [Rhodanobacter sp.]
MHIPPYSNSNRPIVDIDDVDVSLAYLNIVKLERGERFISNVPGYETCIVPASGTIDVFTGSMRFSDVGVRGSVWDGDPSAVYIPLGAEAEIVSKSDRTEVFVAGARCTEVFQPFEVRPDQIDQLQYGSDDTKTHRKIKHILGKSSAGKVSRLLVSELLTVGAGGWSGFPTHKHDTDRPPIETKHDEIYNFRFRPENGFGMQLLQEHEDDIGHAFQVVNGSTVKIGKGYHPSVAAPGYEMYYFTILAGQSQRPLIQYFQPSHAYQLETIPGIKDMIAKFK